MRDERTLTERVERIEQFLHNDLGLGEENSGCDRAVTGQRFDVDNYTVRAAGDKLDQHTERAGNSRTEAVTSLEEIANRIQTGTDRICMIASKLEEIGNRVFGAVPEEAAGLGGAERKPDGMLDHTFITLNWLDQALCRLHAAAARLERV